MMGELKKRFGVVHGIAWCHDCKWKTEGYKNAQAIAAVHAKSHGHCVGVEIGTAGEYDGRHLTPTAKEREQ